MEIHFKKVYTAKDLVISTITLAAGIGLYFVNAGIGIVVAVCGLLLLLFLKSGYKRPGDKLVFKKKAFDVAHTCRDSLKGFLEGKDVEPEVRTNMDGGIIRLEVWYNTEAAIAYAQLFDFSNYNYEPATELIELHDSKALKLIGKL